MHCIGIDLAWGSRARTGLAILNQDGRLIASTSVRTDDEIAGFLDEISRQPGIVVAIDAPLIVPNETGQRPCERQVNENFQRFHAGAYPANRGMAAFNPLPRGARLAERFGWDIDPRTKPRPDNAVAIEVYPHPAMVSLFGLSRVLKYKRGRGRTVADRRSELGLVMTGIEKCCGSLLRLDESSRWTLLRAQVDQATRPVHLNTVEDEIDAILCAYLAWMWSNRRSELMVHGDANSGFIVTPFPPRQNGTHSTTSDRGPA